MLAKRAIATATLAAGVFLGGCMAHAPQAWRIDQPVDLVRVNRTDSEALDEAIEAVARLEYSKARANLADLVPRFESIGDMDRAAKAMFWLSYCYEKTGHKNQADVFYRRIVQKYPRTAASRQARASPCWRTWSPPAARCSGPSRGCARPGTR